MEQIGRAKMSHSTFDSVQLAPPPAEIGGVLLWGNQILPVLNPLSHRTRAAISNKDLQDFGFSIEN